MTTEILSRIQFAATIAFHILFPSINLGLAIFIAIMEGVWVKTHNPKYLRITKFWTKIFAITFGMGVVSGIVMAYEIGTNFGPFITQYGNVLGALFIYETLGAFFLEAGFLGIMLFGWKRVSPKLHYAATLMVAIGTTLSAFWIMSANSWMQTPAGYELIDGKVIAGNWFDIVFNPSFLTRVSHMVFAAYVTSAFIIAGISAYYLFTQKEDEVAKTSFSFALWAALIVIPIQIYLGDTVGLKVHDYQPLKTAAMEGVWDTQNGAPLLLFAYPDQKTQQNKYEIKIPHLAALINTHQWDGELIGLKSVPASDQPPVAPVFFSFRIMVGIGLVLFLLAIIAVFLRKKDRLFKSKPFLLACILASPLGLVATVMGWTTAEVGRQPWIVYNLMRTQESVSNIPAQHVALSLTLIFTVYTFVFGFYIFYLFHLIRKGPAQLTEQEIDAHRFYYMTQGENP